MPFRSISNFQGNMSILITRRKFKMQAVVGGITVDARWGRGGADYQHLGFVSGTSSVMLYDFAGEFRKISHKSLCGDETLHHTSNEIFFMNKFQHALLIREISLNNVESKNFTVQKMKTTTKPKMTQAYSKKKNSDQSAPNGSLTYDLSGSA